MIQVTTEHRPKSEVLLRVSVPDEILYKNKKDVLKNLGKRLEIPGFRVGHIPLEIVEEKFGEEALRAYLIDRVLPESYKEAIVSQNLNVISRPKVEIVSEKPFSYEAFVAVFPKISLKNEEDVRVTLDEVIVKPEDIDGLILDLRKQYATYNEIERPVIKGDRIEIDFEGCDEKSVAFPEMTSKNHPLILGDGLFLPEFEEHLVSMTIGEEKQFSLTFPQEYQHKKFRGKTVHFKVKLLDAAQVILSDLNESFFEKILDKKVTEQEFREEIGRRLRDYRLTEERRKKENELIEKLMQIASFEISDLAIEQEIDAQLTDLKENLKVQGISFDDYDKMFHDKGKNLREELRKDAERKLRTALLIQHLFDLHTIQVSDEEVREFMLKKENSGLKDFQVRQKLLFDALFQYYLKSSP